jgi:ubiquinone/menaquinone biosynthesis C-methylase UbiE
VRGEQLRNSTYRPVQISETSSEFEFLGHVDAVLFNESLHHVADEKRGLAKAFEVLRPGGLVGIIGESNWRCGDAEQEKFLNEEIARFGTLESPFTSTYLHYILHQAGFVDITAYHGVNGFYPTQEENLRLKDVSELRANLYNNFTARRPVDGE